MNIKNKELYNKLKDFVIEAYGLHSRCSDKKYWYSTSAINYFYRLKSFIDCKEIITKDPMAKKMFGERILYGNFLEEKTYPNEVLLSFFNKISPKFRKFNEGLFNKIYADFEDFLYSEEIEIEESSRLYNFEFEGNEIKIGSGLSIKRSPIKKPNSDKTTENVNYLTLYTFASAFLLQRIHKVKKIILPAKNKIDKHLLKKTSGIFDSVITTLRILKPSYIYRSSYIDTKINNFKFGGNEFSKTTFNERIMIGKEFKLYPNGINKLRSIFNIINDKKDERLKIASSRLFYGADRGNLADKIIDYIVGFESLFLPKETLELKFKLALRAAFILESKSEKREETFEFLKKMYKLRGFIVHGEKHKSLNNEEISRLEEFLRKSIVLYISNPGTFNKSSLEGIVFNYKTQ